MTTTDDVFEFERRHETAIQLLIDEELVTEVAARRYRLEWANLAKRREEAAAAARAGLPPTTRVS